MKSLFTVLTIATILMSCQKGWEPLPGNPKPIPPQQEMVYTDLNFEITRGKSKVLDIDKNGTNDILFATQLVGDAIYHQDKLQFFVTGAQFNYFLMGPNETSPIYSKSEIIPIDNQPQHTWFDISFEILSEKITPETGSVFWNGQWKNASNKYFGFQLSVNNKRYNGWIKMSFDTQAEKLTVHSMAISKIAGKDVLAGE